LRKDGLDVKEGKAFKPILLSLELKALSLVINKMQSLRHKSNLSQRNADQLPRNFIGDKEPIETEYEAK